MLVLKAIQGPFKVSLMSLIGTVLVLTGTLWALGLLAWYVPGVEPDGSHRVSRLRR
jgi:hypothetical protein